MTQRWGDWWLVLPGWQPDESGDGIVEVYESGRSHLRAAIELWQLAGDADRGTRIDTILSQALMRTGHTLRREDIEALIQLLDGLESQLIGTVVDEQLKIRRDQLPELRRRTTMFSLDELPGYVVENAIAEGLGRVAAVRANLKHALEAGLEILLD